MPAQGGAQGLARSSRRMRRGRSGSSGRGPAPSMRRVRPRGLAGRQPGLRAESTTLAQGGTTPPAASTVFRAARRPAYEEPFRRQSSLRHSGQDARASGSARLGKVQPQDAAWPKQRARPRTSAVEATRKAERRGRTPRRFTRREHDPYPRRHDAAGSKHCLQGRLSARI